MNVVSTIAEARAAVRAAQRAGKSVGLVPTMGALHEGHLSLVDASRAECDFTAATIFVNPTQFAPTEDLSRYPRPLEADLQKLAARGTDLVFTPAEGEMYRPGSATSVDVGPIALPLEGAIRATHFRGVATIVLKLFQILPADRAYFGQKDYQQTRVISRMVEDLNVPVEIRVCPIVREADGLAMSSRNIYLSPTDRQQALALSACLRKARQLLEAGEREAAVINVAMQTVLIEGGIREIDYALLVDRNTLEPVTTVTRPALAVVAARVGSTRLIDNEILTPTPA